MKLYHDKKLVKKDKKETITVDMKSHHEFTSSKNNSMIVIKSFRPGSGSREISTGLTTLIRTSKAIAKNVSVTIDNSDDGILVNNLI